jgi:CBS domain-containing protein
MSEDLSNAASRVWRAVGAKEDAMDRKVRDVMTPAVVTVPDSAAFKEIVRLMDEHGVSALPVVDRDGRLVGIVSEAAF